MIGADDTNRFAGGESRFRLEFIANNRHDISTIIKTPRPRGVLIIECILADIGINGVAEYTVR